MLSLTARPSPKGLDNSEPLIIPPPGKLLALTLAAEAYLFALIGYCLPGLPDFPLGHLAIIAALFAFCLVFFAVYWEHATTWVVCPDGVLYIVRPSGGLLRGGGSTQLRLGTQAAFVLRQSKKEGVLVASLRILTPVVRRQRIGFRRSIKTPLPPWAEQFRNANV
ncbi:MAG: hypothetical protein ACYCUV_12255 [Phycisphaerae bacterium]